MPLSKEKYIHRIGRSGHFGRRGVVINMVIKEDIKFISEIESFYNIKIEEMPTDVSKIYEWRGVQKLFFLKFAKYKYAFTILYIKILYF